MRVDGAHVVAHEDIGLGSARTPPTGCREHAILFWRSAQPTNFERLAPVNDDGSAAEWSVPPRSRWSRYSREVEALISLVSAPTAAVRSDATRIKCATRLACAAPGQRFEWDGVRGASGGAGWDFGGILGYT